MTTIFGLKKKVLAKEPRLRKRLQKVVITEVITIVADL